MKKFRVLGLAFSVVFNVLVMLGIDSFLWYEN